MHYGVWDLPCFVILPLMEEYPCVVDRSLDILYMYVVYTNRNSMLLLLLLLLSALLSEKQCDGTELT